VYQFRFVFREAWRTSHPQDLSDCESRGDYQDIATPYPSDHSIALFNFSSLSLERV